MSYTDGVAKTVTSAQDGSYSLPVSYNWSGTITPSHPCYIFTPSSTTYSNFITNQMGQNYTATFNSAPGCTEIDVTIGADPMGTYGLQSGQSIRPNYPTIDAGPVVVQSQDGTNIVVALREMWNNQATGTVPSTSFAQLMGIPLDQLSDTYYLPHYNDVSPYLDAQLRFGNVDTIATEVTVTIGGVDYGPYPLDPNESFRINYPTIDAGPVVVKSNNTAKIVVALREMWNNQATGTVASTSFAQIMGIPLGQLSDTYVLPHYNDVSPYLDAQLRFGNVDTITTEVTVTIGGVDYGPYPLDPNESFRINYPTIDAGPVVTSNNTAKIVVALREMWNNQATGTVASTSFAQLMGIPFEALSDTYYLPHYNDLSPYLDAQLRFGVP